jgi:DNA-binding NarL/FixJ family response regulator/REP element-mobilizing transposase RayT
MAKILILDREERSRKELEQSLAVQHTVTSTPMMRGACLILAQEAQDLAFVSLEEGSEAVTALRRFQPALPIVLTSSAEPASITESLRMQVQGTLVRTGDAAAANAVVQQVLDDQVDACSPAQPAFAPAQLPRPAAITARLAMEVDSSGVSGLLLSRDSEPVAWAGKITDVQAADITRDVHREWQNVGERGALLRFHLLRESAVDVLLYTRSIGNGHLLTVIAPAESRLGALRAQIDRLAAHLEIAYAPATAQRFGVGASARLLTGEPIMPDTRSFALAWRPDTELPAVLLQPLRKALDRCARANECQLKYAEVGADFVSVVVQCPVERDGSWLAQRLKHDTESDIRQRLGVDVTLWEDGHLARETSQPFSRSTLATYIQGV